MPQLTCVLSFGMLLVFDLGLNRPLPNAQSRGNLFEIALRETINPGYPRTVVKARAPTTLEEQRAFLGIFFISSAFAPH